MHLTSTVSLCACSLALSAPWALADVLDVGGAAPDFATIAAAVGAAAEGDVIRVHAGSYAFFAVDAKSLSIIGIGDVEVSGTVRVRNITEGQSVLLSGLEMSGVDSRGFVAHDNAGLVIVQDCSMTGGLVERIFDAFAGGYALRSDRLVLVDTQATGAHGGFSDADDNVDHGGDGFLSETSSVSVYGCTFQGGVGGSGTSSGLNGGAGYSNRSQSIVFAAGSTFRGGRGGIADECEGFDDGGDGGPGIRAEPGGQVTLLDNEYFPGMQGFGFGNCAPGDPGVAVWGSATYLDGSLTRAALPPSSSDASTATLHFVGPAGHSLRVAASPVAGYRFLPALAGVLHADPPSLVLVALAGSLDPAGGLDYDLTLPDLPTFGHVVWTTQAVVRDPATGVFILSSPRWTTILDAAW